MTEQTSKGIFQRIGAKLGDKLSERAIDWVVTLATGTLVVAWIRSEWACINKPWCQVRGRSLGVLIGLAVIAIVAALVFGRAWHRARRDLRAAQSKTAPSPRQFRHIEVLDD